MEKIYFSPILNNTPSKLVQTGYNGKKLFEEKKDVFIRKIDLSNDGKFSKSEAARNLVKGFLSPVTFMFENPKNFITGVGIMATSAALMIATSGAVAPVLLAIGVGISSLQLGKGIYKVLKSKNGDNTEKAFFDIGMGSSGLGLSLLGAKNSLKQAHISINDLEHVQAGLLVKNMNPAKALVENIKMIPQSLTEIKNIAQDGTAIARLSNWLSFKKPVVAVIDNFKAKSMDIDGDFIPDLSHGKVVNTVIKGNYKKANIIAFDVATKGADGKIFISTKKLGNAFKNIANRIDKGERIDSVNVSLGGSVNIKTMGNAIGKDLTRGNILENRGSIRNILKNPDKKFFPNPKTVKWFREVDTALTNIERVTQKGVKVYISGGNDGPHEFNLFNLAKGTVNVGATDALGTKMGYTADSKLINRFAQGTKSITPVYKKNILEGYDLTGKGKVDIPVNKTSGENSIVSKLAGNKAKDLLLNNDEFNDYVKAVRTIFEVRKTGQLEKPILSGNQLSLQDAQKIINKMSSRIISGKQYIKFLEKVGEDISPATIFKMKTGNKAVNCVGSRVHFDIDKRGFLVFDPDGSGRKAISVINGTSFSSPRAVGLDLSKNFANTYTANQYIKNSLTPTVIINNSSGSSDRK